MPCCVFDTHKIITPFVSFVINLYLLHIYFCFKVRYVSLCLLMMFMLSFCKCFNKFYFFATIYYVFGLNNVISCATNLCCFAIVAFTFRSYGHFIVVDSIIIANDMVTLMNLKMNLMNIFKMMTMLILLISLT